MIVRVLVADAVSTAEGDRLSREAENTTLDADSVTSTVTVGIVDEGVSERVSVSVPLRLVVSVRVFGASLSVVVREA